MTHRRNRWGPDGPPAEAYSRVTNAERFRPIHGAAKKVIEHLMASYEVERQEGYGIDPELEARCELTGPTVRLIPGANAAAPLVIAFSAFPGVHVRAGRWHTVSFPGCGCDACDETTEGEIEALECLVNDVAAGRMRESIAADSGGAWWKMHERWSTHGGTSGRSLIDEVRARDLLAEAKQASFDWQAWPRRETAESTRGY